MITPESLPPHTVTGFGEDFKIEWQRLPWRAAFSTAEQAACFRWRCCRKQLSPCCDRPLQGRAPGTSVPPGWGLVRVLTVLLPDRDGVPTGWPGRSPRWFAGQAQVLGAGAPRGLQPAFLEALPTLGWAAAALTEGWATGTCCLPAGHPWVAPAKDSRGLALGVGLCCSPAGQWLVGLGPLAAGTRTLQRQPATRRRRPGASLHPTNAMGPLQAFCFFASLPNLNPFELITGRWSLHPTGSTGRPSWDFFAPRLTLIHHKQMLDN